MTVKLLSMKLSLRWVLGIGQLLLADGYSDPHLVYERTSRSGKGFQNSPLLRTIESDFTSLKQGSQTFISVALTGQPA